MIRPSRTHVTALGIACVALTLAVPVPGTATVTTTPASAAWRASTADVLSAVVAQQLGVKLAPGQADEFEVGASLTGSLVDPALLARFGVADAAIGARVSMMRSARERVRVEVDELDPVPRSRKLTLRLSAEGRLAASTP